MYASVRGTGVTRSDDTGVTRSDDGGQTWTNVFDAPADIDQAIDQEVHLPAVVCDPANPHICYRIAGQEQVEESRDGGQTWQVGWSIPWGRRSYMERSGVTPRDVLRIITRECPPLPPRDLGPYNLTWLSKDGTHSLVVAMGDLGVLVRSPEGVWQRYELRAGSGEAQPSPYFAYEIEPSPYSAEDLSRALGITLLPEAGIWLIVGVFTLLGLCSWSWWNILSRVQGTLDSKRSWKWATWPALGGVVPLLLVICFALLQVRSINLLLGVLEDMVLAASIVTAAGLFLTWRRVASVSYQGKMAWRAARDCVLTMLGVFPLVWLPFPLWAFGVIPLYEIALVLSLLLAGGVLWWGIRRVGQASQLAGMPPTSSL